MDNTGKWGKTLYNTILEHHKTVADIKQTSGLDHEVWLQKDREAKRDRGKIRY